MGTSDDSFVPIGLPRGASAADPDHHRIGLHLLETLDALTSVYESAEFFATVPGDAAIADYTLDRCLQAADSGHGAIWFVQDDRLQLQAARGEAQQLLAQARLGPPGGMRRATFFNEGSAGHCLGPAARDWNLLVAPITAAGRPLGLVLLLQPTRRPFNTLDVRLVSTVTSQAAIALSSALHYRDVALERARLHSLIEHHSQGIIVLRPDGTTLLANPQARRLCCDPADVTGADDCLALLQRHDPGLTLDRLCLAAADLELALGTGSDRRILGIQCNVIRDPSGALANVILTLRDITRLRREEQLKRDFLSLISHKFRTPITAVCCALRMLDEVPEDERGEFMREIATRTDELSALVDRLLYFAELMEGSWSTRGHADLRELRDELDQQLANRFGGRSPRIEWRLGTDALEVLVPASRLRVVLDNLLDNAIKFSPGSDPWVRVTSRRTADSAFAIDVEDHGPGIPEDQIEQVFRAFHQCEDDFTGNVAGAGIGLGIVREIVGRLGGQLEFANLQPHGARFTVLFPSDTGTAEAT